MPALVDPVPAATLTLLRSGVLALRAETPRGRFTPYFCVGIPGGLHHRIPEPTPVDHALRTETCAALLDAALADAAPTASVEPFAWLVRPGRCGIADVDMAWLSASLAAYGEVGLDPTMVVMTRQGWHDPRSGCSRTWARLRPRS